MGLHENLTRLRDAQAQHEAAHEECRRRAESNRPDGTRFSSRIPLAHARSSRVFEDYWRTRQIQSKRDFHGGAVPTKPDGTPYDEVILGIDDDVFTYAGPFRYPQTSSCGILFSHEIENQFRLQMTATPFDSGSLIRHCQPKDGTLDTVAFLRSQELPVPDYRNPMTTFLCSTFDAPTDYIQSATPKCDTMIPIKDVKDGDARRWTFEVRFEKMVSLDLPMLAIFLPRVVAQEPWAKTAMAVCRQRKIRVELYTPEDGQDWRTLLELSAQFIKNLAT